MLRKEVGTPEGAGLVAAADATRSTAASTTVQNPVMDLPIMVRLFKPASAPLELSVAPLPPNQMAAAANRPIKERFSPSIIGRFN